MPLLVDVVVPVLVPVQREKQQEHLAARASDKLIMTCNRDR